MRVLVCGDRNWTDRWRILEEFIRIESGKDGCYCGEDQGAGYTFQDEFGDCLWCDATHYSLRHMDGIITGGARGADKLAESIAEEFGIRCKVIQADWTRYGKAAGYIRNQQMLDNEDELYGKVGLVLAFHDDIEHSKGTADMVRRARAAGVPVKVISHGKNQSHN